MPDSPLPREPAETGTRPVQGPRTGVPTPPPSELESGRVPSKDEPAPDWVDDTDAKSMHGARRLFVLPNLLSPSLVSLVIVSAVFVFLYGWLYLGAFWDPVSHLSSIEIAVYNADVGYSGVPAAQLAQLGPLGAAPLGTTITGSIFNKSLPISSVFSWVDLSGRETLTLEDLEHKVDHEEYWGALYFPPDLSSTLFKYLSNASGSDAPVALQATFIYSQGRQLAAISLINSFMGPVVQKISQQLTRQIAQSPNANVINRSLLTDGLTLRLNNLHPVNKVGQNFAVYILVLILWLGALITVGIVGKFYHERLESLSHLHRRLSRPQPHFPPPHIALSMIVVLLICAFVQAFLAWTIPLSLPGVQYDGTSRAGVLFFLWFLSFTFQLIVAALAALVGLEGYPIFGGVLLIVQLLSSGGIYPLALTPGFFQIGRAFPFFYAVRELRFMFFSAGARWQAENLLVIAAWLVASTVAFYLLGMARIRRSQASYAAKLLRKTGGTSALPVF